MQCGENFQGSHRTVVFDNMNEFSDAELSCTNRCGLTRTLLLVAMFAKALPAELAKF